MTTGHDHDTDAPFLIELAEGESGFDGGSELERLHQSARTRQRWLLAVVVLVGIGSIWSMRQYGGGPASALAAPGEDVVARYLQAADDPTSTEPVTDPHLSVLHRSYTQQQIPLDDLTTNPFLVQHAAHDAAGGRPDAAGSSENQRARRLVELEELVRTMNVQSTMTGRTPLASINGKVLRTGEAIDGGPEHVDIVLRGVEGNSVQLEATDTVMDISGTWTVYIGR